jgi:hypothetical protein
MYCFFCIISFIGFMLFVIAGFSFAFESNKTNLMVCLSGLTILILSIVFMDALNKEFDAIPYENKYESTEYIMSLEDNFNTNGHIYGKYCSRGYVNEDLYYSYMVILSDGGFISNKIPSDQTKVYETNDNFRVECYVKSKSWLGMKDSIKFWKMYIPKDSMTENFDIDLK